MKIAIQNIRCYAYHGVFPVEQKIGQWYAVDIELKGDFSEAVENDELEGTVDYAKVIQTVQEVMKTPQKLVEKVAGEIGKVLIERFSLVDKGLVRIKKLAPPVTGHQDYMSFEFEFKR